MTKREETLCIEIANSLCHPYGTGIEIGGEAESMLEFLRILISGRPSIREKVLEYCEFYIDMGEYSKDMFGTDDKDKVIKMVTEDYDRIFY